jgi:hypothetical protein
MNEYLKGLYIMRSFISLTLEQVSMIRLMPLRRMRWAGHVACMKRLRNAYTVLIENPEGTRPRGHRQKTNIRMDPNQIC